MTEGLLNVKEVQAILRISERTVFRLIKDGKLRGFRAGREWRFSQSDLDDYIDAQRKDAYSSPQVVIAEKPKP